MISSMLKPLYSANTGRLAVASTLNRVRADVWEWIFMALSLGCIY